MAGPPAHLAVVHNSGCALRTGVRHNAICAADALTLPSCRKWWQVQVLLCSTCCARPRAHTCRTTDLRLSHVHCHHDHCVAHTPGALCGMQYLPGEAMGAYQQDLRLVEEGLFKLPWDMTALRNRQYNPLHIASQVRAFSQVLALKSPPLHE